MYYFHDFFAILEMFSYSDLKMKAQKIFVVIALLLAPLFLSACSHDQGSGSSSSSSGSAANVDFTIEATDFEFNPDVIEAAPGETISVQIIGAQGLHDFVIDELDVETELLAGGNGDIVDIKIPEDAQSGEEFEFYCSMSNHRSRGMVGTLRIK